MVAALVIVISVVSSNYVSAQVEITTDENMSTPIYNETTTDGDEPKPVILNTELYTTQFTSLIVGEVLNNFTYPIESVQVSASVYDKNGVIVATDYSYASDDQIKPGEKSGFSINLGDKVPNNSKYVLTSTFQESDTDKQAFLGLNVGKKSADSFSFKIVGEVINSGPDDANSVHVSGIFYDQNHKILDTTSASTHPDTISSGKKAPFELTLFSDNAKKVKSMVLNVQSNEYSLMYQNSSNTTKSQ